MSKNNGRSAVPGSHDHSGALPLQKSNYRSDLNHSGSAAERGCSGGVIIEAVRSCFANHETGANLIQRCAHLRHYHLRTIFFHFGRANLLTI